MVREQIEGRGIRDPRVLDAMRRVERRRFVPEHLQYSAYDDMPLPLSHGQSISQPYIVALMTELLELKGDEKALDVGTGSGYQAAILSLLAREVHSIERIPELAASAAQRLEELGYANVRVHTGDGTLGLPEAAPFDAIVVAASSNAVPRPLVEQLAPGGRLVLPVGPSGCQTLLRILKRADGTVTEESYGPVVFVPLVGEHGWPQGG